MLYSTYNLAVSGAVLLLIRAVAVVDASIWTMVAGGISCAAIMFSLSVVFAPKIYIHLANVDIDVEALFGIAKPARSVAVLPLDGPVEIEPMIPSLLVPPLPHSVTGSTTRSPRNIVAPVEGRQRVGEVKSDLRKAENGGDDQDYGTSDVLTRDIGNKRRSRHDKIDENMRSPSVELREISSVAVE